MDIENLLAYYRRRYELAPESRLFAPLADLLRRSGEIEQAVAMLEEGLAHHPRYVSALVLLALCQLEAGDQDAVRETCERVRELDPDNLVALALLASEAKRRQAWSEAAGLLERVVAIDPGADEAAAELGRLRAQEESVADEPVAEGPDPVAPAIPEEGTPAEEAAPEEVIPLEDIAEPLPAAEEPGAEEVPVEVSPAKTSQLGPKVDSRYLATKTLADIYLAQGYPDKALEVLGQILARQPDREDVRVQMAELAGSLPDRSDSEPVETESGPVISEAEAERSRESRADREHFESWLEKIRQEPE